MDDIKVLIYIAFGVIWVISRIMKNRKKQQTPVNTSEEEPYQTPEKEVSFEDLLKELTQGKQEKPVTPDEEPIKYEEPVVEEEVWTGSDEEVASVYEQSIKEAEKEVESVSMKEQGHNHHLERFDAFEEEQEDTFLGELRVELQEEGGLKKALIYKEILDRKHF